MKEFHNNYLDSRKIKRYGFGKDIFLNVCQSSCENGLIFRPNGNIEKCTISLGDKKNIVGKFDNKVEIYDVNKKWSDAKLSDKCLRCEELLTCMNLCCRKKYLIDGGDDCICVCEL